MIVNPKRIEFTSYGALKAHLNRWSARHLVSPEAWVETLLASREWVDYSARNRVLLASYGGVDGPVAGVETWNLVPSSIPEKPCAVRGGEHGWPVRVPVTTGSNEPDPYIGGVRPTRSSVEQWEWRSVFSADQLARRPAPDAFTPPEVPKALRGKGAEEAWVDATRQVAATTVRGPGPKDSDTHKTLTDAARRVSVRADGAALEPAQLEQVAWLVADRVGQATGPLPAWDPELFRPQDRWQMMTTTLDTSRRLTAALGVVLETDLLSSPLPKMDVVDDRVIPTEAVRRLPKATFERLPVGEWVDVGPYRQAEWAARGERGDGAGAFFRLNASAYIVAVEDGDTAAWRLHDIDERTGYGLIASGTADTLDQAKHDAEVAMRHRFPALAAHPEPDSPGATPNIRTVDEQGSWRPMAGEANTMAQQLRVNEQIVAYVLPGPGGRWLPAIQQAGELSHLPYARTREDAQTAATQAAKRASRLVEAQSPAMVDQVLAEVIRAGDYSRDELVALGSHHLLTEHQHQLADPDLPPQDLVELVGAMGASPTTTALILHAEGVDPDTAAQLLPVAGVPMDHGIRLLNEHWDIPRVTAAEALGATATEMRDAGCPASEVMAARPREVLRSLPSDPQVWELAAGSMATAGHTPARIVSHLVAHAPTPHAFAVGLHTVTDGHTQQGLALAVRYSAQAEDLAATTERYGLSPADTATALADAGVAPAVGVEALHHRCHGDANLIAQLAHDHFDVAVDDTHDYLTAVGSPTTEPARSSGLTLDPTDPEALLHLLPDPGPATQTNPQALVDLMPDPQPALDLEGTP